MKKLCTILVILLCFTGCSKIEINIKNDNSKKEELKQEKTTDEDITKYIEEENEKREDEKVFKKLFITLTDFLFYDGKIKGKTFKELKVEAQSRILQIYEEMSKELEKKYPNYQEDLKKKFKDSIEIIKGKKDSLKETIIEKYQEKYGTDSYQKIIDTYEDGKEIISDAYNEYMPDVKEKYEGAKEAISSWYEEYKESK